MLPCRLRRQRTCGGVTRRAVLQVGASTVLGLSLAGRSRPRPPTANEVGAARLALGGPAHLDTWTQPDAPLDVRDRSPPPTRTPASASANCSRSSAARSDRFAASGRCTPTPTTTASPALSASPAVPPGRGPRRQARCPAPRSGAPSVVAKARGGSGALAAVSGRRGKLHQGKKAIVGEAAAPSGHSTTHSASEYDPVEGTKVPALQLPPELTPERLDDRSAPARSTYQTGPGHRQVARRRGDRRLPGAAFALLTSPSAREASTCRRSRRRPRRYGRTRFRPVVPVPVGWWRRGCRSCSELSEPRRARGLRRRGWDHHYRNFQIMQDATARGGSRLVSALR